MRRRYSFEATSGGAKPSDGLLGVFGQLQESGFPFGIEVVNRSLPVLKEDRSGLPRDSSTDGHLGNAVEDCRSLKISYLVHPCEQTAGSRLDFRKSSIA